MNPLFQQVLNEQERCSGRSDGRGDGSGSACGGSLFEIYGNFQVHHPYWDMAESDQDGSSCYANYCGGVRHLPRSYVLQSLAE